MLEYTFIATLCGVFGIVFTEVLTAPGMIFSFWARWLDKLPEWLAYPLGGCSFCFTGQVALWVYMVHWWGDYDLFYHAGFVTLSILYPLIYINIWKSNT